MVKKRVVGTIVALALLLPVTIRVLAGPGDPIDCTATNTAKTADCSPDMRAVAAQMAAHPHPEVTQIPIDEKLLYAKGYRKVLRATPSYDAPHGNVVGSIENGFIYVNALPGQDGWFQIGPNQWLPPDVLGGVNKAVSKFSGVALSAGMPDQPFGWVLLDTKPSSSPGADPPKATPTMKRYTLVNFFATEQVNGWDWYLIGPNQWIVQTRVARLLSVKQPEGVSKKWFAVDLYEQTMIAYEGDKAVFATLISSGLEKWPTNEGVFQVWDRYESVKMSGASGQPDYYYLPQVPFVMYFNHDEQALHGTYWHDGFGFRHSHGCVNLSITDAQWSYEWTKDQLDAFVYVYSSGDYKKDGPR
jgi:hypothetical protein